MNIKKSSLVLTIIGSILVGSVITWSIMFLASSIGIGTVKISEKEYKHLNYMDKKYSKMEEIWTKATSDFYTDVDEAVLENAMYKGFISGLDDIYSNYMTKEQYDEWKSVTTGEFEGIGITFHEESAGVYTIVKVNPNGPAKAAGLLPGDVIKTIDGKTYDSMDLAGAAMRGKSGTKVDITYLRDGKENTVNITRAKIIDETVSTEVLDGNIGYIQITDFESATGADFTAAVKDMESKGVKGLVIDIRNNGGGLVTSGVTVADQLLDKGTVAYLEDRNGKTQYLSSEEGKTKLPYVLLVNENTASTSEILAAGIKDNNGGPIVGTTTYGKGVVQVTNQLQDGSALKLTTYQYFSPKGSKIHQVGIEPDYKIDDPDKQLEKAIELLK